MRQIALDTETTGLNPGDDRVIEIACVDLNKRQLSDQQFHTYVNPERSISKEAIQVHGITQKFLEDKPLFVDVCDEFLSYVQGAEVLIHNADFDIGFLDAELKLIGRRSFVEETGCKVVDTLKLARERHPGLRNSLDEICKRYFIDNSMRDKHDALLDATLLARAYLAMTGGQTLFELKRTRSQGNAVREIMREQGERPLIIRADTEELQAHEEVMEVLMQTRQKREAEEEVRKKHLQAD